jgi:hypothetical protein
MGSGRSKRAHRAPPGVSVASQKDARKRPSHRRSEFHRFSVSSILLGAMDVVTVSSSWLISANLLASGRSSSVGSAIGHAFRTRVTLAPALVSRWRPQVDLNPIGMTRSRTESPCNIRPSRRDGHAESVLWVRRTRNLASMPWPSHTTTEIEGCPMRRARYAQKHESWNRSGACAYRLSTVNGVNRTTSFRSSIRLSNDKRASSDDTGT